MTGVLVLLSTWNGERYLSEQLDSLFAQDLAGGVSVLVRDDGSSDDTVGLIQRRNDPRIRLVQGENLGPRGSFFELLKMAKEEEFDFFALCDQDDVWNPRKLGRAASLLGTEDPGLYASSLNLVDDALNHIGDFEHPGNRSFTSTLLCNFVTGCTCVFNKKFLDNLPMPIDRQKVIMHDWWLASIASIGTNIVYDRTSFIDYRQHAANHVGIRLGIAANWLKLRRAFRERSATARFDQAQQLLAVAGDRFDDEQRRIVTDFLAGRRSWFRRLGFVLRYRADIAARSALRFVAFR